MWSEPSSDPGAETPGAAPQSPGAAPTRNLALDYVRATALVSMCLTHMLQRMLRWDGLDRLYLMIAEGATCLFFIAFGMTQNLLVQNSAARKREYLLILGVVAMLHSYFSTLSLSWEFFSLLWASAVVVVIGDSLGMGRRGFLILAAAAALLNIAVLLGTSGLVKIELTDSFINSPGIEGAILFASRLWILPGPFYPLPWALLVFFGFGLGLDYPPRPRAALLSAVVLLVAVAVARILAGTMPDWEVSHHLALSKFGGTSTYIATGAAATILLLVAFGALHTISLVQRRVYPVVRFLSDHMLEGTTLHFIIVAVLTLQAWGWTGGGGLAPRAPTWMIVVASLLNTTMLVVGLKLALTVSTFLCAATGLHEKLDVNQMAGAAITWLALLHVCHVTGLLGYLPLRWLAFCGMVALAFAYGDARRRRRERLRGTAVLMPRDRRTTFAA